MKRMIATSLAMTAMFGAATAGAQISGAQIDAAAGKVEAKVVFNPGNNPMVMNNAQLTQGALPSLKRVAGEGKVVTLP